MNRRVLILLLFGWSGLMLHAQSKPEWQRAYELLERNTAKTLTLRNQLLLNELTELKHIARQKGDSIRVAELEVRLDMAQARQNLFETGRVWHPGRQDAGLDVFCLEALGKKWTLEGTRQVRGFRLEGRAVVTISDSGRESKQRKEMPLLPGVFATLRQDDGFTVYLISPDMRQALCVVVPRIYESRPAPRTGEPVSTEPAPKVAKDADLLTFLKADVHSRLYEHEKQVVRFLQAEYDKAVENKASEDIAAISERLTLHHRALDYYRAPAAAYPVTTQAFAEAAQGALWEFPGHRKGPLLQFHGQRIRTLDGNKKELETSTAEIIWPGLLLLQAPDGSRQYLAISADTQDAILLPIRSRFPGRLAE